MQATQLKTNSNLFKALGHIKRLEIICLLQGHSLTVNHIVQMTGLRQAAVSQHLMTLKKLNLVRTEKMGKEMYYTLNKPLIKNIADFTESLTKNRPLTDAEPTVIDPICLMHLTPTLASYTAEYDGVRHYFCGKGCLREFNTIHK
jgi:DNA-binding transcriptional ArsR family regulator